VGAHWKCSEGTQVRQIIRNQNDGLTHRDCDQKAATLATKLVEGSKKVKWMGPSSTAWLFAWFFAQDVFAWLFPRPPTRQCNTSNEHEYM
jgi:hypothetical protein